MNHFNLIVCSIVFLLGCQAEHKNAPITLLQDTSSVSKGIQLQDTSIVGNELFYVFSDPINFNGYGLKATINNKTYTIIDTSEHVYILKIKEMDFDGDNNMDVLLAISDSWGGNCCGSEYFFVSYVGNGEFRKTDKTTESFNHPLVEKWNGLESIVVQTTNSGVNNDDYSEVNNRYILKQGELIQVEEMRPLELMAIKEVRAKEFSFGKKNEIHKLKFDLNNDGKLDTIICSFYERWGSINWKVSFSNDTIFESNVSCKRIGVLKSKTNNVYDLVVDLNTILVWDGNVYK